MHIGFFILRFRLYLFDDALIAGFQPCLGTVAVRAFPSVPHRLVAAAAVSADRHRRNRLEEELCLAEHRIPALEIIPAVHKQVRHNAGHFSDLQRHRPHPDDAVFPGQFRYGPGQAHHNAHFMHIVTRVCPYSKGS